MTKDGGGTLLEAAAPEAWARGARAEETLLFHKSANNTDLNVSRRVCQGGNQNCTWQYTTKIADTINAPSSAVVPGTPPFILDTVYVCYRNPAGLLKCKRRTSQGAWHHGPHPNVTIEGGPSMAYWDNHVWIAYRKPTGVFYYRALVGSTWGSEYATGHDGPRPPALASAQEDSHPGSDNRLWLVFRHGTSLRYAWYNVLSSSFTTAQPVGQPDQQNLGITNSAPAAAIFRGRLHVSTRDPGQPGTAPRVWYASCQMPCNQPTDWTRLVPQPGTAMAELHLEATSNADRLTLWHLVDDPSRASLLHERSKMSE